MGVIVYMLLKFRERYNGTFTRELVTDTYKKSTQMKGNVGYLKVVVLKGWLVSPFSHTRVQFYRWGAHLTHHIHICFGAETRRFCHFEDS